MRVFRLESLQALQAGVLSGGVTIDTVSHASPNLHPAVLPTGSLTLAATYTAPQVMANVSGIAPTAGTNTQTGVLNRPAGAGWASFVATGGPASPQQGLMTTPQFADYVTLVPPTNIALVQITLAGMLQVGMSFKSADRPDGTHLLAPNDVRNGARATITLDQQAPVVYDTYNQTQVISVYLDGTSQHAIRIAHSGLFDSIVPVLGPVTPGTGASLTGQVAVQLSATQGRVAAASPIAALWTITAASASTYTLTKTVPGGAPVTVGATFNTNQLYDSTSYVPGVAFQVSGVSLVAGHTATFTTDVTTLTIESVAFYTSTGSMVGQYVTPILDSGDPNTQWFLYEHTEAYFANGSSTLSVRATTGNALQTYSCGSSGVTAPTVGPQPCIINANSDLATNGAAGSYSVLTAGAGPTTLGMTGVTVPSTGDRRNAGGLMPLAAGRYAQFTVQLAVNTQNQSSWARDFSVYSWVPSAPGNALFIARLGLPPNWSPGPNMQAYYGSLLTFTADLIADINDFNGSYGLATAKAPYLLGKGQDLNQPHVLGEPTSAYQTRLTTFLQAKTLTTPPTGIVTAGTGTLVVPKATIGAGVVTLSPVAGEQGAVQFICQQLAELLNGTSPVLTQSVASSTGYMTVSGGGVTVAQIAGRGITITLPNPPYPGLPGLAYGTTGGVDNPAKAIIKQFAQALMPAGTLFDPTSSTYLNFGVLG